LRATAARPELPLKQVPSSVLARFLFLDGLLLVILVSAHSTRESLNVTEAQAAPVVYTSQLQEGCPILGGQKLTSTNGGFYNIVMHIALGHLADGSAAEISLGEIKITTDSYTPDVLGFSMPDARNGAELIRDDSRPSHKISDGTPLGGYMSQPLRQVKVPETLLDIIVSSQWEYELRFYHPNQVGARRGKLYELVGEPFAVYRFRNPNPPFTNRFEITKIKDGKVDKSEYFYDAKLDFWSLTTNGQEVARKRSEVNPRDPCERIETRFNTEHSKVIKTLRIFKGFPWGQNIVKEIEDPDGEAKTTTFQYFEDPNGPHYTFLKTTIHPDGEVEQHNQQPAPTMRLRKQP
jgi:hypothetical protein